MSASDKDKETPSVTPSICEEALEGYRHAEDTFASLIRTNHIEVREFMVLSFVCDQDGMEISRIRSALGLSLESTLECIARLRAVELVTFDVDDSGNIDGAVRPTPLGRNVVRRVLSDES